VALPITPSAKYYSITTESVAGAKLQKNHDLAMNLRWPEHATFQAPMGTAGGIPVRSDFPQMLLDTGRVCDAGLTPLDTIPPPWSKATFRHCLPTLTRFTHTTPHTIFSQSEHVEPSILPNWEAVSTQLRAFSGVKRGRRQWRNVALDRGGG